MRNAITFGFLVLMLGACTDALVSEASSDQTISISITPTIVPVAHCDSSHRGPAYDGACMLGQFCNDNGQCRPRKADGQSCMSDHVCTSRHCAAGICQPSGPSTQGCIPADQVDEYVESDTESCEGTSDEPTGKIYTMTNLDCGGSQDCALEYEPAGGCTYTSTCTDA